MISVLDLHKTFGQTEVLSGISAEINKGDVVCIIGPSGSGKSTFLRCLNVLEKPTSGKIIFEGNDLTDKEKERLKNIEDNPSRAFLTITSFLF